MNKLEKVYLKDIADTQTGPFGTQLHEKDYVSEGTPIVTVEHLGDISFNKQNLPLVRDADKLRLTKYTLKEGDIVFSRVGSVDRCTYVSKNEDGWMFSGRCLRVRFNEKANAKYVSFYFRQKFFKEMMLNISVGATMPSLNTSLMANIPLYLPKKDTQNKIASVLSAVDSKIELNNKINAELEAMAKTIYDYWFVQFDFPNAKGKPYKSSGGKMVWNEELKREIPEKWEVKLLGTEIEIQRGISYTSKEINGEGIPMINLASFNLDGTYKPEGVKSYSGKFTKKNIVRAGELLIAATDVTRNADIIGKAILVPDYYSEELVFSMDIAKIVSDNIPSSYLMMLFNSNHYHNYIKWFASGTIVLHLNLDGTKRYNMELPPKQLLEKFDDLYQPIFKRIGQTKKENQQLTSLRDWLLPMLMNGQVKVKDAERIVEEKLEKKKPVTPIYKPKKCTSAEKAILAGHIINLTNKEDFGRVKFQKLLHLTEYHCHLDLGSNYVKNVAGPYDKDLISDIESTLKQFKFFEIKKSSKKSRKIKYTPLSSAKELDVLFNENFKNLAPKIDLFLTKFKNSTWEQCEIVSTLYAAWNNRIITKENVTDTLLKKDFLAWDKQKVKYKDRLDNAIEWMRKENIVPEGWGNII